MDVHLRTKPTRYLLGDELTYADCLLMPRLQHVRVVGKAFEQFEVPGDLLFVWKYYADMYETTAFLESCPDDRDLITQYEQKSFVGLAVRILPMVMSDSRLLDIPPYVLSHLETLAASDVAPAE
jgi:chloride intracellular channel protein 2